jgi:transcriptional regulator with XRE-family HTH domain
MKKHILYTEPLTEGPIPIKLSRMTLPELLERYRVYTIRDFADRTGLSSQQAWNLWHGVVGIGRLNLQRIHEALGIPFDELMQVERKKPAQRRERRRHEPPKDETDQGGG